VAGDQFAVEPVDAGGHRGVGGEDGTGAHRLERRRSPSPYRSRHELADALQAEEPGVALVGVEHLGRGVPGERQYARTARTPPMPSSISCSSRCSLPPP
jgi:hypothetical protein